VPAISAASILAMVHRDRQCLQMDEIYPAYGFARHKGYPTAQHLAALREHGVTPWHRRTFGPVQEILARG
jgi:ribonuclease HII